MSELSPNARAILDAARGAHEPDDAARERVRSAMMRRLGVGAAIVSTTTAATTTAAATKAGVGVALLAKVLLAVAVVGGGGYAAKRAIVTERATVTQLAVHAPIAVAVKPKAKPIVVADAPKPAPIVEEPKPAPVVAIVTKKVEPISQPSPLEAELATLRAAHAALRDGEPARALLLLDTAKTSSVLAQEHHAARILALCALGRADGRALASGFLADHPQSPHAARIRTACGLD